MATRLRRTDLFGFTPQDNILTAEEDYGYVPEDQILDSEFRYGALDSESLEEELEYGALNSPSLAAELRYGDLNSPSLAAELRYGALNSPSLFDELEYGADEEGMSDVPLFGGAQWDDSFGDDDSDLDEIERQMDSEVFGGSDDDDLDAIERQLAAESFGEDPAGAIEQYASELSGVLYQALSNYIVGSENSIVASAKKLGRKMTDLVSPGDLQEISGLILSDPAFPSWNSLSPEDRTDLVRGAIASAAIPGIEFATDDAFREAWESGTIQSAPRDLARIVRTYFADDTGHMMWAVVNEIPGLGAALQAAGINGNNFDQYLNIQAGTLYLMGLVRPDIFKALSAGITEGAQNIISAMGVADEMSPESEQAVIREEVLTATVPLPEPSQELPDQGIGLPEPPQILAVGYGAAIVGSLLGILR